VTYNEPCTLRRKDRQDALGLLLLDPGHAKRTAR
jgi:hypothetical protein